MDTQSQRDDNSTNSVQQPDWDTLYWDIMPRIYNFFRYRVTDDALAEDLTAQTFEKAWRFRTSYRDDLGAFSTWLFTIARNVHTDHLRRAVQTLPLDVVANLSAGDWVEEQSDHRDDLRQLTVFLEQLPEREHELIALKYGADLTNREIAQITGLSESNVGTLLHRIVRKLRAEWELLR